MTPTGKPLVLVLMGVAGSGKTTIGRRLAAELGWPFFDADDFHPSENIARMAQGVPLTDEDRQAWLAALQDLIHVCLRRRQPAVLACSALKQAYRSALSQGEDAVQFVYLKGSYELIHERLRARQNHYMKPGLLASQFDALEEPADALMVDIAQEPAQIISQIRRKIVNERISTHE